MCNIDPRITVMASVLFPSLMTQ
uniref:Uncharacterized protein n=1 Tax=Anguilla anguilla TaxID=7936 RepID=A0A0E9QJ32_ANGAN